MNGIGTLNDRYRLLVCSDFGSQFVSFFSPQKSGDDLFLGCRYNGDQMGAVWFEMEEGEWIYRSCYRFEDFERTAMDNVYSVFVETQENTYTLYLSTVQEVSLDQLPPTEEGRQPVLLNAAKEPVVFELPPDTVSADSPSFLSLNISAMTGSWAAKATDSTA